MRLDSLRHLVLVIGIGLCLPSGGAAAAEEEGPPASFFAGRYEIVGRSPGEAGRAYSGWGEVTVDGERLSIVRCVQGRESRGTLEFVRATGDRVRVVRSRFRFEGEAMESTCQIHVDLDNYPRLTCHTYPASRPEITTPGIEALFHVKWPVEGSTVSCP